MHFNNALVAPPRPPRFLNLASPSIVGNFSKLLKRTKPMGVEDLDAGYVFGPTPPENDGAF